MWRASGVRKAVGIWCRKDICRTGYPRVSTPRLYYTLMARRGFAGFLKHFSLPMDVPTQPAQPVRGQVVSVQSNAILLTGLTAARQGQLLELHSGQVAWIVALLKNYVGAVVLSKDLPALDVSATIRSGRLKVVAGEMGKQYSDLTAVMSERGEDLLRFLQAKMPFPASRPMLQWLSTGYYHIDMFTPLALGQFIYFKGKRNTGKTRVAVDTVRRHLQASEKHRAIYIATSPYSSPSPILTLLRDPELAAKLAVYTPAVKDGLVGQFLSPYAALLSAVHLREAGHNVLLVLDDAFHQAQNCISAFAAFQPHFSPLGFLNLLMDHCRVRKAGSLTGLVILHENTENATPEYRVISQNLEANADRALTFQDGKGPMKGMLPSLDFRQQRDHMPSVVHWPIYKEIARRLGSVLDRLVEEQKAEESRETVGLYSPPWDKYLLLDSRFFLQLMQCGESLSPQDLLLFAYFQVYTIENELASTFQPEIPVIRAEFLQYIRTLSSSAVTKVLSTLESLVAPAAVSEALSTLDKKVNEPFYKALKVKGMLKDYREDYDDLIIGSGPGQMSALDRSESTGPKSREIFKELYKETLTELGVGKKK